MNIAKIAIASLAAATSLVSVAAFACDCEQPYVVVTSCPQVQGAASAECGAIDQYFDITDCYNVGALDATCEALIADLTKEPLTCTCEDGLPIIGDGGGAGPFSDWAGADLTQKP